jgi:carbon storage regulator CsrA
MSTENKICRLVLTVKYGESVKVGTAEIIVSENRGQQVKMIISAPKDVKILRSKVIDRDAKNESVLT